MEFFPFRPVPFSILDPSVSVFLEKSGTGSESGSEVVGIRTEVEMAFFRPYFRNSIFGQNFSVFIPDFLPYLNQPINMLCYA